MDKFAIDDLTDRILRIHTEPYQYITEQEVHHILVREPLEYLTFLEKALTDISHGSASIERPAKMIFKNDPGIGDFRVMPCVFRHNNSIVKTVKIVGTNLANKTIPDQVTVGKAFCIDPHDNHISHIYEACLLSSARTGACASIGLKHLANKTEKITIVGSGRVAYYIALYFSTLANIKEIIFQDAIPERANQLAQWGDNILNNNIDFRSRTGNDIEDSDVIVLATTSEQDLWGPDNCNAPLIISVGADTETQRELSSSWADSADIYVDVADSIAVGDLRAWKNENRISTSDITDLLGLLKTGPRDSGNRHRIFISTGSAFFDNLTIAYLQQKNLL